MATGDLITATRYNQIQANVSSVLGIGAADFGYGTSLESSQVATTQIITAEHINKLRKDILAIFVHQRGSNTGFSSKNFNALSDVNVINNTITILDHEFATGQEVIYNSLTFSNIPGLETGKKYLIERMDQNEFKLFTVPTEDLPISTEVNIQGTSTGVHRFVTNLEKQIDEFVGNAEYASYSNLSSIFLANRNQASLNNLTLEPNRIISTRNTPWGGSNQSQSVFHEVRVQFANANARRHFFNTGSEIRFSASLTNFPGGPGQLKFNNWTGMLSSMGTISFKSFETTNTGSGTALPVGNFNLTSTFQPVFTKSGSSFYDQNTYVIQARALDTRTIIFLIEFNDLHTGSGGAGGIDEPVEGILTSRVSQFRASGTSITNISKVIAPTPAYQNIRNV
jgi:hypothetical protein